MDSLLLLISSPPLSSFPSPSPSPSPSPFFPSVPSHITAFVNLCAGALLSCGAALPSSPLTTKFPRIRHFPLKANLFVSRPWGGPPRVPPHQQVQALGLCTIRGACPCPRFHPIKSSKDTWAPIVINLQYNSTDFHAYTYIPRCKLNISMCRDPFHMILNSEDCFWSELDWTLVLAGPLERVRIHVNYFNRFSDWAELQWRRENKRTHMCIPLAVQ